MIYLSGLGQFLFDVCLYGFVSDGLGQIMMETMTDPLSLSGSEHLPGRHHQSARFRQD
jgi:hypothetical protein